MRTLPTCATKWLARLLQVFRGAHDGPRLGVHRVLLLLPHGPLRVVVRGEPAIRDALRVLNAHSFLAAFLLLSVERFLKQLLLMCVRKLPKCGVAPSSVCSSCHRRFGGRMPQLTPSLWLLERVCPSAS
jgi:hypothetical protein